MSTRVRGNPLGQMGMSVAANVRIARVARGLSQQQVSNALAEMGHPIPVSSIGRIENGDRRVEVDDLAAIGSVLQVRPERLLTRVLRADSMQPWREKS